MLETLARTRLVEPRESNPISFCNPWTTYGPAVVLGVSNLYVVFVNMFYTRAHPIFFGSLGKTTLTGYFDIYFEKDGGPYSYEYYINSIKS